MVEINSSFYRPHRSDTYARWADAVPRSFRFAVKFPRVISHERGLRGATAALDAFLAGVQALGERLGVLLLQLPPGLVYDGRSASSFLLALRRRTEVRVACEPRHASWFTQPADALLCYHDIARVAADPSSNPSGSRPGGCLEWSYWRWHGSPRMYYSPYEESALQALAAHARSHSPAWVVLDNTANGFAVPNGLRLLELMKESGNA